MGNREGNRHGQEKSQSSSATRTGEGFLLTEGALVDDPYWDAIMETVHQERKGETR
jgi:hypothetical protein